MIGGPAAPERAPPLRGVRSTCVPAGGVDLKTTGSRSRGGDAKEAIGACCAVRRSRSGPLPATTPRFPVPARGRGRKGRGRFPRRGLGGTITLAAKRLPLKNLCRIAPPCSYGGDPSKNQSRAERSDHLKATDQRLAMPNHGGLAWQSPVADMHQPGGRRSSRSRSRKVRAGMNSCAIVKQKKAESSRVTS